MWLSRDPMRRVLGIDPERFQGPNLYGYVGNNPIRFVDPDGLASAENHAGKGGRAARDTTQDLYDPVQGVIEFLDNYNKMREANTIGADKYFHCLANCEAAKKGAARTAEILSGTREFLDEHIKGGSSEACDADQVANRCPKEQSCKEPCEQFRPKGLDAKY